MSELNPTPEGLTFEPDPDTARIEELLFRDPLAEKPPAPEAAAPAPTPSAPSAPAPVSGAPAPAAAPAATQPAIPGLEAHLQQQTETLRGISERLAQPAPQPAMSQQEQLARTYAFQVPPNVIANLRSDDDAVVAQTMQAIMAAPAIAVHQQVMRHLETVIPQLEAQIMQRFTQQATVQQQQTEMRTDFYGRFKHLDIPELRPSIVAIATNLTKDPRFAAQRGYTPAFGDALAAAVEAAFPQLKATPSPTPGPTPRPAAPAQIKPGARPVAPAGGDIADLLGL